MTRAERWWGAGGPLGSRDFALLFAGQATSQIGDWLNRVALMLLLYRLTGEPIGISFLFLAQFIPRALLLPVGGVLADRWPKRTLMIATDLARAVLALSFILAPLVGDATAGVALICAAVVGIQALTSLFNPARSAILPKLVPTAALGSANALVAASAQAAMLIGPGIGGLIVAVGDVNIAFAINAATFLLSAALLWPIRVRNDRPTGKTRQFLLRELRAGAAAIRRIPPLPGFFVSFAFVAAGNILLNVVLVDLLVGSLGQPESLVGPLLTAAGIGGLVGAPIAAWLLARLQRVPLFVGAVVLAGIATAIVGAVQSLLILGAGFILLGVATIVADVTQETSIQQLVPAEHLGRAFSLQLWTATIGNLLGAILGGLLPLVLSPAQTLVAVGTSQIVATLIVLARERGRADR